VRLGSGSDNFLIQRAAIGSTTFQDLYSVSTSSAIWSDGAGGTRMTLNSQGLGVGAVPSGNNQLTVRSSGAGTEMTVSLGRASAEGIIGIAAGTNGFVTGSVAGDMVVRSIGKLMLFNNTANSGITIDSSGNVGVGVTPSAKLDVSANDGTMAIFRSSGGSSNDKRLTISSGGAKVVFNISDNSNTAIARAYEFQTAGSAAMTLDASGNFGVGTTNPAAVFGTVRSGFVATGASGAIGAKVDATGRSCLIAWNADTAGDNNFIQFFTEATLTSRGSITYNRGSGQVAYNITSDYRLKEDIKPLTGAINRIASLKPSTYKLKETGFVCEGFIAHELAEVVPMAVTGAKDAVDSDGKPLYQAVDLSKIVPVLVAAIQELTARVQTLEAR
jgi:hypothetical protein